MLPGNFMTPAPAAPLAVPSTPAPNSASTVPGFPPPVTPAPVVAALETQVLQSGDATRSPPPLDTSAPHPEAQPSLGHTQTFGGSSSPTQKTDATAAIGVSTFASSDQPVQTSAQGTFMNSPTAMTPSSQMSAHSLPQRTLSNAIPARKPVARPESVYSPGIQQPAPQHPQPLTRAVTMPVASAYPGSPFESVASRPSIQTGASVGTISPMPMGLEAHRASTVPAVGQAEATPPQVAPAVDQSQQPAPAVGSLRSLFDSLNISPPAQSGVDGTSNMQPQVQVQYQQQQQQQGLVQSQAAHTNSQAGDPVIQTHFLPQIQPEQTYIQQPGQYATYGQQAAQYYQPMPLQHPPTMPNAFPVYQQQHQFIPQPAFSQQPPMATQVPVMQQNLALHQQQQQPILQQILPHHAPIGHMQQAMPAPLAQPAAQQPQAWPTDAKPSPFPAPTPPPAYSIRKVSAQFDWAARSGSEMSFRSGEVLEILRDSNGDGWLLARKGKEEGMVPEAYVTSY
jgi:hypothetical protein